jgi:hypothetical protein
MTSLPYVPAWLLIGAVLFLAAWLTCAAREGWTVTRRRLLIRRLERLYALPCATRPEVTR